MPFVITDIIRVIVPARFPAIALWLAWIMNRLKQAGTINQATLSRRIPELAAHEAGGTALGPRPRSLAAATPQTPDVADEGLNGFFKTQVVIQIDSEPDNRCNDIRAFNQGE